MTSVVLDTYRLVHMLTRCLATATPMMLKLSSLLLPIAPLWILSFQGIAFAQVNTSIQPATSDTTVVRQSNQVDIVGGQSTGGTEPNLIHQFEQFNLNGADAANFVVDPEVANIINLINDTQPSAIDGLLKLTSSDPNLASNANLFLVNPAGVIFGENVRLSLPANLTATTASGLLFEDRYLLSVDGEVNEIALQNRNAASSSGTPAIGDLEGNPTGYLMLVESAGSADPLSTKLPTGSIQNRGELQVAAGSSVTLIGQYVQNDGDIIAPGGVVTLTANSGNNLLRLSPPGSLITLDVVEADTLALVSSSDDSAIAALPNTDLAQLLTGGGNQDATHIQVSADGSQTLTGSPSLTPTPGTVMVRGSIDVSDNTPSKDSGSPGQVTLLGDQINLIGGHISADGISHAGTISIGGMPVADGFNAAYVLLDRNSRLSVDSTESRAGIISIWANDTVQFYGEATATGGSPDLDGIISIDAGTEVDIRQPTDNTTR